MAYDPSTKTDLKQIPEKEFFATVGKMNVHPSPRGPYDQERGYVSEWTCQSTGRIMGYSDGGTHLMESRYFVRK